MKLNVARFHRRHRFRPIFLPACVGLAVFLCRLSPGQTGGGAGATPVRGSAGVVSDAARHFTIKVPAGFTRDFNPSGALYSFSKAGDGDDPYGIVVIIADLHEVITPEMENAPADGEHAYKVTTIRWNGGRALKVYHVHRTMAGVAMAFRVVPIPLAAGAIEVGIGCPADKESTLDEATAEWVAGIDGPTNWSTPEADLAAERRHAIALDVIVTLVGVIALVVFVNKARARSKKLKLRPAGDLKVTRVAAARQVGRLAGAAALTVYGCIILIAHLTGKRQSDFVTENVLNNGDFLAGAVLGATSWSTGGYWISRWVQRNRLGPLPRYVYGPPVVAASADRAPGTAGPPGEDPFVIVDDTD